MESNIRIRLADENDTEKINSFITKAIEEKNNTSNAFSIYKDAFTIIEEYSSLNIRAKLYNFKEEFFLVEIYNELKGIVAFKLPEGLSKAFNLSMIILEDLSCSILNSILEFAKVKLLNESIIKPIKIRANINNKQNEYYDFVEVFSELGFIHEVTREHEITSGYSVTSLVLPLNREAEEKVC